MRSLPRRLSCSAIPFIATGILLGLAAPARSDWTGAATGTTNDGSHSYLTLTATFPNWNSSATGPINDSFATSAPFTAATTIFFGGSRTTGATGLNLNYSGAANLTFTGGGAVDAAGAAIATPAAQKLTLGGDITGDFGGSGNSQTVTLGSNTAANQLGIILGAATRTFNVATGDTLVIVNSLTSTTAATGVTKTGGGQLNLNGTNTFAGGLNINGGTVSFLGSLSNLGGNAGNGTGAVGTLGFDTGTLVWATGNVADISIKTVTVNAGGATLNIGSNNVALANAFGNNGAGGVTKLGSGTLTLLGANTFTGAFTQGAGTTNFSALNNFGAGTAVNLNGGTIQWASGTGTDISARTVTINATTNLDTNGNTVTLANAIGNGGAGGLTKTGAGTLILQGTNTYTGGTTVNNGLLQFDNAGAVAGTGATLSVAAGGTATTGYAMDQAFLGRVVPASAGVIALKGDTGALDFNAAGLTAARLGAVGNVTYTGALTPNGTTYRLGGGGGTLTMGNGLADSGGPTSLDVGLNGTAVSTVVLAGPNSYTGATTVGGGVLQFANPGAVSGLAANSVLVNAGGAAAFAYPGVQSDLNNKLNATSTGTVALTAASAGENVNFASPTPLNTFLGAAGGTVTYTGTFTPNGTTYRLGGGGGTLNFGAAIPAGNSVVIGGGAGGTVILSNPANGFDAGLTLNGSVLQFSTPGNLGSAANAITFAGGTLQWAAGNQADVSTGRTISINAGGATFDTNGNAVALASPIGNAGTGTLTKAGAGTLSLFTANTYTGTTTVAAGTLSIADAGALGTGTAAVTVGAGAALQMNGTSLSKAVTLNGSGVANDGALRSNGTSTMSGAITLGSATTINADSGSLTFQTGAFNAGNNALTIGGGGNVTINSVLSNVGSLTYNPSVPGARLTLGSTSDVIGGPITVKGGGILSYPNQSVLVDSVGAGVITLDNGTLENTIASANGTFTPAARDIYLGPGGGTFLFNAAVLIIVQDTPFPGTTITGPGGLTKDGAGIISVVNPASYLGPTRVKQGTLRVRTNSNVFPTGTALTVDAGAIFDMNGLSQAVGSASGAGSITLGSGTFTVSPGAAGADFSGVISGTGAVTKNGTGTQVLSGPNTYTGLTTISRGTLSINTIANVGGGASAVGAPTTAANGTIKIGSTTNAGVLQYTGAGGSTDRVIDLAGTTGGATIDSSGAGALTMASNFTATGAGSKTLTLTGTNTGANTIGGAIVDNSAANITTVTKSGAGTWVLAGTNTFTGPLNIGGGILNVATLSDYGVASAIGARAQSQENNTTTGIGIHIQAGGILQYTGSTPQSTNREIRIINGLTPTIDASGTDPSATLSFTHAGPNINLFDTAGTRTLNLTGTNAGANTFGISVTDQSTNATSLNKAGAGTWVLTGASTYTGTTTVNGGKLVVGATGSIANSSAYTVGAGAILDVSATPGLAVGTGQKVGGFGTVAGNVAINSGGSVTPGSSPGTMTVSGGTMAWNPNGTYVFDHDPTATGAVSGGGNDLIQGAADNSVLDLSGLGTGSGQQFNLVLLPTSFPATHPLSNVTYTIADFSQSTATTPVKLPSLFSGPDLTPLFSFPVTGYSSNAPTVALVGNQVQLTFTPVPEPAFVLLGCGAAAGAMGWWKRRRTAAAD